MKKKTPKKRNVSAELDLIFRALEEIRAELERLQKRTVKPPEPYWNVPF